MQQKQPGQQESAQHLSHGPAMVPSAQQAFSLCVILRVNLFYDVRTQQSSIADLLINIDHDALRSIISPKFSHLLLINASAFYSWRSADHILNELCAATTFIDIFVRRKHVTGS